MDHSKYERSRIVADTRLNHSLGRWNLKSVAAISSRLYEVITRPTFYRTDELVFTGLTVLWQSKLNMLRFLSFVFREVFPNRPDLDGPLNPRLHVRWISMDTDSATLLTSQPGGLEPTALQHGDADAWLKRKEQFLITDSQAALERIGKYKTEFLGENLPLLFFCPCSLRRPLVLSGKIFACVAPKTYLLQSDYTEEKLQLLAHYLRGLGLYAGPEDPLTLLGDGPLGPEVEKDGGNREKRASKSIPHRVTLELAEFLAAIVGEKEGTPKEFYSLLNSQQKLCKALVLQRRKPFCMVPSKYWHLNAVEGRPFSGSEEEAAEEEPVTGGEGRGPKKAPLLRLT